MLLQQKSAVIHGAGGAIGAAVARAFVREGATVHLAGRSTESLEALAGEIGAASVCEVDAFSERAVEATLMMRRMPLLADLADAAAFHASDHARCLTATVANLTGGATVD